MIDRQFRHARLAAESIPIRPLDLARIHQYALRPIGAPRSLSSVPARTPITDQSSRDLARAVGA
jgi:hypothetical protein